MVEILFIFTKARLLPFNSVCSSLHTVVANPRKRIFSRAPVGVACRLHPVWHFGCIVYMVRDRLPNPSDVLPPPLPLQRLGLKLLASRHPAIQAAPEWAYGFDVHLNAFFPLALGIYGVQGLFLPCESHLCVCVCVCVMCVCVSCVCMYIISVYVIIITKRDLMHILKFSSTVHGYRNVNTALQCMAN